MPSTLIASTVPASQRKAGFSNVLLACQLAGPLRQGNACIPPTSITLGVSIAPGSLVHNLFSLMNEVECDAVFSLLIDEEVDPGESLGNWTLAKFFGEDGQYQGYTFKGLNRRFDLNDREVSALLVLMGS